MKSLERIVEMIAATLIVAFTLAFVASPLILLGWLVYLAAK